MPSFNYLTFQKHYEDFLKSKILFKLKMFESVLPTVLVPCVVELLFVVPELVLPLLLVLLVLELLELFELFELFDELEPLLPFTSRLVVLLSDDHLLINYQHLSR